MVRKAYNSAVRFIDKYLGIPLSLTLVAAVTWVAVEVETGLHNVRPSVVAEYNIIQPLSYFLGTDQVSTSQLERALQNPKSVDAVMEFREKSIESVVEVGGFLFLDENKNLLKMYEAENTMERAYKTHEEFAERIRNCNEEQFPLLINEYNKFMDSLGYPHTTQRIIRRIREGRQKSEIIPLVNGVLDDNSWIHISHFTHSKKEFYKCYESAGPGEMYVADFHFHDYENGDVLGSNTDIKNSKKWRTVVFSVQKNGFDMYDLYKGKTTKIEWRKG